MVSAAGKNIPVLLSPVGDSDGDAVEPAPITKLVAVTIPLTLRFPPLSPVTNVPLPLGRVTELFPATAGGTIST
jgi:hypothetical protein